MFCKKIRCDSWVDIPLVETRRYKKIDVFNVYPYKVTKNHFYFVCLCTNPNKHLIFSTIKQKMTALRISDCLQKNARTLGFWAGAMLFLLDSSVLFSQSKGSFEAAISTKEVVVGLPFELTFTLKNVEGARFTAPNFSGFRTSSISESRSMGFNKGQSTSSQTWSVELTATKPGTFNIGSATVFADGKTLSTKSFTVNALPLSASSKGNIKVPPGADDQVFIAAEFDQKEAYVGQQVTWRIRLYTQLSVDGYDIISLPDFGNFFSREKTRYDKRVEYINLRRKKYAVRTLHEEAIFPQEIGELNVGAARVSVGIEQPGAQGFLFGPKPVSLQTQPISLTVKTLPQPPPTEFTGAVGQYEWTVKADTSVLSTDDALTIVVEVSGNGDSRRFAPPKIAVPGNSEIFEPRILEEEEYESETEILHRKRFEYIVLPKDTGSQEINPIFTYFNPDSNRYCQLQAATIKFRVTPGKNYQSPNQLSNTLPSEPSVTQPSSLFERIGDGLKSPIFWSILALPFLALGIFMLLKKRPAPIPPITHKPIIQSIHPPIIQSTTQATAQKRFAEAGRLLKDGDPIQFYDALFKSLQAWLSVKFGLQPAQMNDADLSAILRQRGATPIRIQALLSVWRTCELAIYGGQAQVEQMEATWQMANQVLEALEREIR